MSVYYRRRETGSLTDQSYGQYYLRLSLSTEDS